MNETNLTPAMQQFVNLKKQNPDCVLFFRLGDFYETFWDDAKTCSRVLDLVLTSKNKTSANPIPMAGIPYHSADKYIQKLIAHGYKVAIAEQMTEPKPGKVVEREVVQITTPGTYIAESDKTFRYIIAICQEGTHRQCARSDVSTGVCTTRSCNRLEELCKQINVIKPVECILDANLPLASKEALEAHCHQFHKHTLVSVLDQHAEPEKFICRVLGVKSIDSFGKALSEGRQHALGLLLSYVTHTMMGSSPTIHSVRFGKDQGAVTLDDVTIRNLELFQSTYEQSNHHSLIGVIDQTKTMMGTRLLKEVIQQPLQDTQLLIQRQEHVLHYQRDLETTKRLCAQLAHLHDIPKVASGLLNRTTPLQLQKLFRSLRLMLEDEMPLRDELERVIDAPQALESVKELAEELSKALKEDITNDEIGYIQENYNKNLQELSHLVYHSDQVLVNYQQELVHATGLSNIKLKYIQNQGYTIELTKKDSLVFEEKAIRDDEKMDFIRRGTLKTGERYTTPYLDNLQHSVLKAKDDLIDAEHAVLEELKQRIHLVVKAIHKLCETVARIDIFASHALFAREHERTQPERTDEEIVIITDGRHPVVEAFLPKHEHFIPNNLELIMKNEEFSILNSQFSIGIITGPNMGGKSTYLRQNALIVLLAQCGLFVPAKKVLLRPVDGIFARIGSADNIAKNQSTFMTEMIEVANILHNATDRSFVILDELGRGTSTYDGLAITKAIITHIATTIKAKTLIATHYHELIALEQTLPGVANFSVGVYETEHDVVFTKKIVRGGANKSYGIDVAKLAGIHSSIVEQAKAYLKDLETRKGEKALQAGLFAPAVQEVKPSQAEEKMKKIKEILENVEVNETTPLKALEVLARLKKIG